MKPSNVLVTERDGTAIPKVIDFGIARQSQEFGQREKIFAKVGIAAMDQDLFEDAVDSRRLIGFHK